MHDHRNTDLLDLQFSRTAVKSFEPSIYERRCGCDKCALVLFYYVRNTIADTPTHLPVNTKMTKL